MPYIGKQPTVGNFQVCDAISVVNGQAAYTLQVGGVNVAPESANHMLVSLNGILQKPGSSFTISGSTITFASNLATGDVIDFVTLLGNVLDIGQPSDDTVKTASIQADAITEAKIADDAVESEHLNDNVISGQTELATAPADTDEFLISDAGTLKRIDYSLIKGGGIEVADNWRLSANYTIDSSETDLDSNWERVDTTGQGFIGTAMSQSSGLFTFPSTGIYFISFDIQYYGADNNDYGRAVIVHNNGSGTKTHLTDNRAHYQDQERIAIHAQCLFDCQNTSTDKIEFFGGGNRSSTVSGSTNKNETNVVFIRLGDT